MAAKEAYITGVGQSEVGVRLPRHPLLLTIDAVREALDDAGLTLDQIDGVFSFPGKSAGYLGFLAGRHRRGDRGARHQVEVADGRVRAAGAALRDRHGGDGGEAGRVPPRHLLPHRL